MTKRREPTPITIHDDYGDPHTYLITPHGAGQGWPLGMRVVELLSGPLGVSLSKLDKAFAAGADAGKGLGIDEVPQAIAGLQERLVSVLASGLGDIGSALGKLAGQLATEERLLSQLLEHTHRDGQRLDNPGIFNQAFTANYGELISVLVEVIKVNWGPLFYRRFGGSLARAQGLFGAAARPTETPPQ